MKGEKQCRDHRTDERRRPRRHVKAIEGINERRQLAEAKAFIDEQKKAEKFKGRKIVTQVQPVSEAGRFWEAEAYHQDYYKKNSLQYKFYVTGCGRYARLDQLWGTLRKQD